MQLNLAVTHFPPQNYHKRFLFFVIIELFWSVVGREMTVKNQEQKEGSKFIWGFNSLDGISGVLISLKPSGLDVCVFQLSIMQSSCWGILNKPLLQSLHCKCAHFLKHFSCTDSKEQSLLIKKKKKKILCNFPAGKMSKAKHVLALNVQLSVRHSDCRHRVN